MTAKTNSTNYKQFLYPPGGILIWIIIIVETITFGAGIIAFAWQRNLAAEMFDTSQQTLNVTIGFINTLFLLTSGFFVAEAIRYLKLDNMPKSRNLMRVAMLFGFAFLFLKGFEYYGKLEHGLDLTHNTFFTFYWLLTGFHFLHVSVGLVILGALSANIRQEKYNGNNYLDVETGAAFWHMCDMIWLLLFPVLYLL
ncbi:MAG TPA: nitric oxide reductase [Bacteroidetes bacterium]|nr:nitric oxide reductase [Bacteroidota bacterium]